MSKVIGLTGGIGSGKTAVSDYLASQGIPIIDLDIIARQVVEFGEPGLKKVVESFGKDILNQEGSLNRAALRDIVFSSTEKKQLLENILHPIIKQETLNCVDQYKAENKQYIVIAYPLLIEAIQKNQRPDYIDEIWVIDCPIELQIKRAAGRDQNTKEQIFTIIEQQSSREQRQQYADQLIDNSKDLKNLHQQIDQLIL